MFVDWAAPHARSATQRFYGFTAILTAEKVNVRKFLAVASSCNALFVSYRDVITSYTPMKVEVRPLHNATHLILDVLSSTGLQSIGMNKWTGIFQ